MAGEIMDSIVLAPRRKSFALRSLLDELLMALRRPDWRRKQVNRLLGGVVTATATLGLLTGRTTAGPPFVTDNPEPALYGRAKPTRIRGRLRHHDSHWGRTIRVSVAVCQEIVGLPKLKLTATSP